MAQHRHAVAPLARRDLDHIPGDDGWLIVGNTLSILWDPIGGSRRCIAKYGPVYRSRTFGVRTAVLLGPEANELVLLDRDKNFASSGGWEPIFGRLFPPGLLLVDFDERRLQRKALGIAFKTEPMKAHPAVANDGVSRRIAEWRSDGRRHG